MFGWEENGYCSINWSQQFAFARLDKNTLSHHTLRKNRVLCLTQLFGFTSQRAED